MALVAGGLEHDRDTGASSQLRPTSGGAAAGGSLSWGLGSGAGEAPWDGTVEVSPGGPALEGPVPHVCTFPECPSVSYSFFAFLCIF